MDIQIPIQPRRASALSMRSIKSPRHRQSVTDREQRIAEKTFEIQENRPCRPPQVYEESVDPGFLKDFFSKSPSDNVASLSRADTGLSPFEVHPGRRMRGFSLATEHLAPGAEVTGEYQQPFAEPDEVKPPEPRPQIHSQHVRPSRADDPEDFCSGAQFSFQRSVSDAREKNTYVRRLYNQIRGRRAIKPGVARGIEFAFSFAMSHASAILAGRPPYLNQRKLLYVLDYESDEQSVLKCAPPKSFERTAILRQYLEGSNSGPKLRIIYSCNNEEAVKYLSEAFGISDQSKVESDRDFRNWLENERPSRGPAENTKRWRPSYDIARDMICTAFGLDFDSIMMPISRGESRSALKASSLKISKPEDSRSGTLHRQRLAIYMQRRLSSPTPGARATCFNTASRNLQPFAETPTVIIFEYSSGDVGEIVHVMDLLSLDPRGSYERKLSDSQSLDSAILAASENVVLDLLDRVKQIWHRQLSQIHEKYVTLEDQVYDQPADDSRARDIWALSQHLRNMIKLVNKHATLIRFVQEDFSTFSENEQEQDWLNDIVGEFQQLSNELQKDYIQPLELMIDMMYKSISIRDSRQSIELSVSLWRLSWITFIFLPLTFLAGVFGMNVDTFHNDPSIKWYFAAAVVMMFLVALSWVGFRKLMPPPLAPKHVGYSDLDVLQLRNGMGILNQKKSTW